MNNSFTTATAIATKRQPRKIALGTSRLKDTGMVKPERHHYGAKATSGLAQALRDLNGMTPNLGSQNVSIMSKRR